MKGMSETTHIQFNEIIQNLEAILIHLMILSRYIGSNNINIEETKAMQSL